MNIMNYYYLKIRPVSYDPSKVRPGRPLALSEPEPTQPFGIPLSEPTYLHRPYLYYLYVNGFDLLKEKGWDFFKYVVSIFIVHKFMQHFCHISIKFHH